MKSLYAVRAGLYGPGGTPDQHAQGVYHYIDPSAVARINRVARDDGSRQYAELFFNDGGSILVEQNELDRMITADVFQLVVGQEQSEEHNRFLANIKDGERSWRDRPKQL